MVGLDVVKHWVHQQFSDCANRNIMKEKAVFRHVMLVGELGTGKHTAATLVAHTARLVWKLACRSSQIATDLAVGDRVKLSPEFTSHGDAASGPLKVGQVGVVINEPSNGTVEVEHQKKKWLYKLEALTKAVKKASEIALM